MKNEECKIGGKRRNNQTELAIVVPLRAPIRNSTFCILHSAFPPVTVGQEIMRLEMAYHKMTDPLMRSECLKAMGQLRAAQANGECRMENAETIFGQRRSFALPG